MSKTSLVSFENIEARAAEYVRWYLQSFGDTLSQQVGRATDFTAGRYFVIAPEGATLALPMDLWHAGLGYRGDPPIEAALAQFLVEFLKSQDDSMVVSEYGEGATAHTPQVNSDWLPYTPSQFATWDGTQWTDWEARLCIAIKNDCELLTKVDRFMIDFEYGTQIALLLGATAHTALYKWGRVLSSDEIERLASGVVGVVVPVCDHESYLIWQHR